MDSIAEFESSMRPSQSPRYAHLDYARVFVAFLVIVGHLLDTSNYERRFIYAFHMPFFFLISGMLHKRGECVRPNIVKYVKTLLFPAFVFVTVFTILIATFYKMGLWHYNLDGKDTFSMVLADLCYNNIKNIIYGGSGLADGPAWFLIVLFGCKLFADFVNTYIDPSAEMECDGKTDKSYIYSYMNSNRALKLVKMGGVILTSILLSRIKYFYMGQLFMAFPFFYIGYRWKKEINAFFFSHNKNCLVAIFVVCIIISFLFTAFNGRVSVVRRIFGCHPFPISVPVFYINAFVASFGVLAISSCFKKRKFVENVAKSLLSILLVQKLFYKTLNDCFGIISEVNLPAIVYLTFASALILLLCHYCHLFINKHMPCVYGRF